MLVETNPYSHRRVSIPGRLDVLPAKDGARFILRIAPAKLALAEKTLAQKSRQRSAGLPKPAKQPLPASAPMNGISGQGKGRPTLSVRLSPGFMKASRIVLWR